ncbi:hypothetical protein ACFQZ4_33620 [Catellatospora coxensis]
MTDGLVIPELDAGPFLLRPFRTGDLPVIQEAAADPYIPVISSVPVPYSAADGLAFVQRQHDRAREGVGYSWPSPTGPGTGRSGRSGCGSPSWPKDGPRRGTGSRRPAGGGARPCTRWRRWPAGR